MIYLYCSEPEHQLIEDIQLVGHGEIYDISFVAGPPHGMVKLDPSMISLLRALRDGEKFNKIIIHDSLPFVGVRVGFTTSGRKFTQKTKF